VLGAGLAAASWVLWPGLLDVLCGISIHWKLGFLAVCALLALLVGARVRGQKPQGLKGGEWRLCVAVLVLVVLALLLAWLAVTSAVAYLQCPPRQTPVLTITPSPVPPSPSATPPTGSPIPTWMPDIVIPEKTESPTPIAEATSTSAPPVTYTPLPLSSPTRTARPVPPTKPPPTAPPTPTPLPAPPTPTNVV